VNGKDLPASPSRRQKKRRRARSGTRVVELDEKNKEARKKRRKTRVPAEKKGMLMGKVGGRKRDLQRRTELSDKNGRLPGW